MTTNVEDKFLHTVAKKLGLDKSTINKAEELVRIYRGKGNIRSVNECAKCVLCLDLAASINGVSFDKEIAVKWSGLKQSTYQKALNIIKKVLDVEKPLTVGELCVQLCCVNVIELAESLLTRYQKQNIHADISHPQYVAVAVLTACRSKDVKVNRAQLVKVSRLKQTQFKELEANFKQLVGNTLPKMLNEQEAYLPEPMEENLNDLEYEDVQELGNGEENDSDNEDYEVWKARTLEESRRALNIDI